MIKAERKTISGDAGVEITIEGKLKDLFEELQDVIYVLVKDNPRIVAGVVDTVSSGILRAIFSEGRDPKKFEHLLREILAQELKR